jgi:16S rRNA (cytidine1402-2'-O)-methyltransferase
VLCPTPVGNLEDITLRALRLLREADVVLCEDTRHTAKLLRHHGIDRSLVSYHQWNERAREAEVLGLLAAGKLVALCSDAGSPGLSDPGQRLVQAAIRAGHAVTALPGPQALVPAVTMSGLPTDRILFLGFLPRAAAERARVVRLLRLVDATAVLFESPHRLARTLAELAGELGSRPAALVREISKVHEEVRRGTLPALAAEVGEVRGECVLVIGGRGEEPPAEAADFVAALRREGFPPREILAYGVRLGFPRNELYRLMFEPSSD